MQVIHQSGDDGRTSLYPRLGFVHYKDIPDRNGPPYAVYTLTL